MVTEGLNEADLYGTWSIDDYVIDLQVAGVNINSFLEHSMGIVPEEAQSKVDSLMMLINANHNGTISFNTDNSYTAAYEDEASDSGTWTLFLEQGRLEMRSEITNRLQMLKIESLTESSLVIKHPAQTVNVDLNGDGKEDTQVNAILEYMLIK